MTNRRTPKHVLRDDWPSDGGVMSPPTDGVGPQYTDSYCEACGIRILATGECRCS